MIKSLLFYWPTALVIAVILYATLASDPVGADELPPIPYIDKLIHAIMIGGLFSAVAFDTQRREKALGSGKSIFTHRFYAIAMMITIVFSICDELLQGAMNNGRGCEFADFIADCVGASVAALIAPPVIKKVLKVRWEELTA